jgi:serine/threonine protein kinase/Tfp pilus assembly protein PilF
MGPVPGGRFQIGDILGGRFKVVRFIARGGMGEVYEVEDRYLQDVHIALKVILPQYSTDTTAQRRFEQEVILARRVAHGNLCAIYDIFHCEEPAPPFSFLTMRLLPGETLAARLARSGPLPPEEARTVFREMTIGIAALHAAGIIHRDIKPNNVMLDGEGPSLSVCITDFGLARLHESEATLTAKDVVAGTRGYMAPELLLGQPPSQATDLYAFGVVLHETFTAEKPQASPGSLAAVPSQRLKPPTVPVEFVDIVTELLSEDPNRRCAAFAHAQSIFDTKPSHSTIIHPPQVFWTRRRFAFSTVAAASVAVAGGITWKWNDFYNLFHPLPRKRFVALLNWPTSDSKMRPMLDGVIDAIAIELARAEAFDHDLFVTPRPPSDDREMKTPAEVTEVRDGLGANLVLATSGTTQSGKLHIFLRLLDPTSTRTLRQATVVSPIAEQISLPQKAVRSAEQLLGIGAYQRGPQPAKPATQSPEAYAAFQAAESFRKQENGTGLNASIESYKQAIELDPHYALAHAQLAFAYYRLYHLNHDPAAIALGRNNSETALMLDPNLVEAHLAMGSFFEITGDEPNALREMAKALSLDPSNPRTLIYQARIFTRLNRWADAEKSFRRVLQERPNYWLAYNELGFNYYSEGKYQQALDAYRAASLAAPKNTMALNNVGSICQLLGNFDEAKDALNKSLAIEPYSATSATMAAVLRSEGKPAEAVPFALKATALKPSDPYNWQELGDCYSPMRGHAADAKNAFLRAAQAQEAQLQVDATNGPGWMHLALYRIKSGAPETAASLIKKAESLKAGDLDSQLIKARVLELLGQRDEALATIAVCMKKGATKSQIQSTPDLESLRNDPRFKTIATSSPSTTETN